MNNFSERWEEKPKMMVTLPKKNFYALLGVWTIIGVLVGYGGSHLYFTASMMCQNDFYDLPYLW